jgi:hypothetical protein
MTNRALIATLSILALTALPAFARGPRGLARPGGPGALRVPGLLGQLIFPCEAACGDDAESCSQSANDTAVSCVSDACATQVAAAQAACQADRRSSDCRTAVADLKTCGATCRETLSGSLADCRSALVDCHDACSAD